MRVVIINKNDKVLLAKLTDQLPGYQIEVYPTVKEYQDYLVKSSDRADLFIMTDNGVGDNIDRGIVTLSEISNYKLFKPKEVVMLNKEDNTILYNKYEFIREDFLQRSINCIIIRKPEVFIDDIRLAIVERVSNFNPNERHKRAVVQVKRGSNELGDRIIPKYSTGNSMLVEMYTPTVPTETIKEQYKDNKVFIFQDDEMEEEIEPLDSLNIEIVEEVRHDLVKYIQVSSNPNSGGSTTALIMAKSGAEEGKTLLVDLSYSLGLSYLAEVNLHPEEYTEIDLTEMVISRSDKLDYLRDKANTEVNLHIMRITLPVIREVGYGVLEYLVSNMLTLIEHNYRYIILDIPLELNKYYNSLSSKVDLLIPVSPPYLNNYIPMLNKLKENSGDTATFKNSQMVIFMSGLPNQNGIAPVSRNILRDYTKSILNKDIPITAIHISNKRNYVQSHIFREIIDMGNRFLSREEVNL